MLTGTRMFPGRHSHVLRRQIRLLRQIELIQLHVLPRSRLRLIPFSEISNTAKSTAEKITPDTVAAGLVNRFTTAIPSSTSVISPSPSGISSPADREIQRHSEFAVLRMRVAQHQHRHAFQREAPDHAERVEVRQERHVAAADHDRHDLQRHHHVDDPVRRAELRVRLPEPVRQHAVFGNAVQHAVRSHNRRVHRARKNQRAHHHHENVKHQPQRRTAPCRFIARPPIRFSKYCGRVLSGMIITAKNETSDVKTML